MIDKEIIDGRVFIAQTTYRIYHSEEDLQDNKQPFCTTSDEETFNFHKENLRGK